MRYLDGQAGRTLLTWIQEALPLAEKITVVTGYLSSSGLALVREPLQELLAGGGQVDIITGVHDGQLTRADAIAALDLLESSPKSGLFLANDDSVLLHAKILLITQIDGTQQAYIGSANLTAGGLLRNLEAGVVATSGDDPHLIQAIERDLNDRILAAPRTQVLRSNIDILIGPSTRVSGSSRTWNTNRPTAASGSLLLADHLEPMFTRLETGTLAGRDVSALATGFQDLDLLLGGGLQPGQLMVIGGRPGSGKSTMAVDIARSVSIKQGLGCAVFSFEMSRQEIVQRISSAEARVPLHFLRNMSMTDDDWTRLASRIAQMGEAPLVINDLGHLTVDEIHAESRRLITEHGVRLIVVDYLQLMRPVRRSDRHVEVAEISRSLKLMARELEVPVVVASQLNRQPESRADRRPQLSDLRESGAVEQDADIVVLLHREDMYDKESPRAGEADFIVAKHRNGPTATITVAFQGHYSRFVDMSRG